MAKSIITQDGNIVNYSNLLAVYVDEDRDDDGNLLGFELLGSDSTKTAIVLGRFADEQSAEKTNLETGVLSANITALEAARSAKLAIDKLSALEGFILTATLNNTQKYPFNNSKKTIALSGSNTRYNKNYTIIAEVENFSGGCVGEIAVSDKLLNGFKIAYTGSAKSVDLKIYVQGGV